MEFYEQLIKQKKNGKDYGVIALTVLGGLIFAAAGFLIIPAFLPLWVFVACWFGYFLISGRCLEYEYALTQQHLDIYRIAAKRRRRKMIEIDLKELRGYGIPGDSGYRHGIRQGLQVLDFSSRRDKSEKRYLIVPRPKGTYVVVIEPDETMLEGIEGYVKLG
ncbi:MAG: hypothetical protein SO147_05515 [Clostridia bacterium]|nr:hypothetical protein [Clostridia bacterium]